jgi:hypothetical protein
VISLLAAAGDPPRENRSRTSPEPPRPLDPRGRMDDHPTDKPARYYLWHDNDGWHLRSCSRLVNTFDGKVGIEQGTFGKLRPIGLDRGRAADQWELNKDRNELKFALKTAQSFDGFDFTIDGADAELRFELLINGKPMPARVFVGRDGEHPREAKFVFPANPEKLDDEKGSAERPANRAASESDAKPAKPGARPKP